MSTMIRLFSVMLIPILAVVLLNGCATHKVTDKKTRASTSHRKPVPGKHGGYYRVRKGDSLYSIAWRAGLDYRTLARWNGLRSPYTIYPGQRIRLSPPKSHSKPAPAKGSTKKPVYRRKTEKPATAPKKPRTAPPPVSHPVKKPPKAASGALHWQWPVRGRILSRFASSDAAKGGIRIGGRKGQKIMAAEAGQVVYVGSGLIGYGQLIIIKHNNKYLSAYGHNSRLLVKEGDKVSRGQHISDMGVTHKGTPLLYFEIRRFGKPVDPLKYLPK
ncbi:peptidoglycan DD-metalloendopeptidase family protein [Thiolapillus brandeum]|nr:peptidoglycan DD-metalloendopeptidase family protein [Thiolapillus brandeum]